MYDHIPTNLQYPFQGFHDHKIRINYIGINLSLVVPGIFTQFAKRFT